MSNTTEEKIIFSVHIDQSDSIDKIATLTKQIDGLKEANKKLAASEGDNTKAIAENNLIIQQASNERSKQNKAVLASMEAYGKEAKSIDDARASVKQLTIERNKLDVTTEEGRKKQLQLNTSIDAQNKFIKDNVDQYQKQKINIGNYASALGGSNNILSQTISKYQAMKDALELGKKGVEGLSNQQASFGNILKANGIGIIIVALTSLYTLFTKFEPVVETLEAAFDGFNAGIKVLSDRLIDFGKGTIEVVIGFFNGLINVAKSVYQILSGDFKGGFDGLKSSFKEFGTAITKTTDSFNGMGDAMADAAKEAYNLTRSMQDLEDRMRAQIVINAQAEEQVSQLILQSKNRTLSEKERLKFLDEAGKIEKANFEQNKKIAKDEYDIMLARLANGSKLSKTEIEELNTNTKRRDELDRRRGALSDKELKELAEKKAAIIKLESETINVLEKIANRRDALIDAEQAKREVQKNKLKNIYDKDNEARAKAYDDEVKLAKKNAEKKAEIDLKAMEDFIRDAEKKSDEETKIYFDKVKKKKELDKADIESSKAVANAAQGLISQLASTAAQGSELQKALALTNVAVNLGTAIGNLTATTSAPSPDNLLTGGVAGFVKYAVGLTQILAAITSARSIIGGAAAGGGDFVTSRPTLLLVGDNPGGRERVTVEPLSGRGKTSINPNSGMIAMAGGGSITTTGYGGYADRSNAMKGIFDYNMLAQSLANMPSPVVLVSEINKAQSTKIRVQNRSSL